MRCAIIFLVFFIGSAIALARDDKKPVKQPDKPPSDAAAAAQWLEKVYGKDKAPEAVRMLLAIARGTMMGDGDGWFGPAETRYTWTWLAKQHGVKPKAGIDKKTFKGAAAHFAILDRDGDGKITAADLDWSAKSAYIRQMQFANQLFARLGGKEGKITEKEWAAFFKKAAGSKGHLTPDDLRKSLLAGPPPGFMPGDAPTKEMLVRGLFNGEIGSLQEGPKVNQTAPSFTLKTHDGKKSVQLSSLTGKKPLVLVFGNFTCGPFRRLYPGVEDVSKRHSEDATFLGVYVREAHPTDGWVMASNTKTGVAVKQPKTYAERVGVCTTFCKALKPAIPFLVDEINDPVGNAYSGMPARLYVIDAAGKVAYKSGRGPFGFKAGEMEQALVMALLEQKLARK